MFKAEMTLALTLVLSISLLMSSCTCQMVGDRVENNCYGDVVPCANNTYDLGSPTRVWENIYVGNLVGWNITSSSGAVGNVTGVGVAGTIPEWASTTSLGNSPITHLAGLINFNTHTLTNVVDPSNPQDAATKIYVDNKVSGLGTGNITGAGTSGFIVQWNGSSNITNASSTDAQLSDAVNKAHTQNTDTGLGVLGTKNPPIDADKFIYRDSTAVDALVTSTGTQVKSYLKTYFDTLYSSGAGYVTNPLLDDMVFGIGTGNATSLLWETADVNANALVLALPDGGATDVPVLVIGDQSVINKDFGLFNGTTTPTISLWDGAEIQRVNIQYNSIISNVGFYIGSVGASSVVNFIARNNFSQYLKYDVTASNIPTLYGTGAYLRVGDNAVTSHSLASEDDLMVSGKLEVDGTLWADSQVCINSSISATGGDRDFNTNAVDGTKWTFSAQDTGVGNVECARLIGAADPYFGIGRDDTGVATNAVTDMLVLQAGAGTNNEAVGQGLGTSWKLGNSASEVEERGSIDLVSTNATNGAEASKFNFSVMDAGAMVNPSLSITANTTATQLTVPADLYIDTGASKTLVLTQPVYDDMMVDMSNVKTPASNAPVWTAYKSTEVPAFSKTATNTLYFTAQVPHRYKEGTNLEFHIHLAYPDNGAGNSIWYFTYSWANRDANYPAASNSGNVIIASPATTDRHQLAELVASISGTGKTVSSVLLCSISRIGGDGSDDYDNVIYLTSSDFHYQVDTMGSRTGTAK